MGDKIGVEKHIYRLLPPSNWRGKGDETVTLLDYLSAVNYHSFIDVSKFLPDNMELINSDSNRFDSGQTYFVISGSTSDAEKSMKEFSDKFSNYLNNLSNKDKNNKIKLEYKRIK